MFSGIGGFEKGIEDAELQSDGKQQECSEIGRSRDSIFTQGKESNKSKKRRNNTCVGFSEIDRYATAIYQYHYPEHTNYGDCTTIVPVRLPDFDLLIGGVPCQSWSIAGKRKGFEDSRGTMWFECFRIIEAKKPKYILFENVKGILSHNGGDSFERICECICELGYAIDFTVLNSKYFGVPQNRERVFIVGIRLDLLDSCQIF